MRANEIIDETVSTWLEVRPDLDLTVMDLALRVGSVARLTTARIQEGMSELGITLAEFDVLATLRRSGPRAELTPSHIAEVGMVKPSGLSHRLAQLEKAGLISRSIDPDDRRSALIRITPAGRRVADRGLEIVVAVNDELLHDLSSNERRTLLKLMTTLVDAADADVEVGAG